MSHSTSLGEAREVELPQGTIRYRESGSGPPVVFVHGLVANGHLWRDVVPELAGGFRCITPDWPLGSHEVAVREDADLSLPGLAAMVDSFLAALDLSDVTLVGNDTGGAIAQQLMVDHPDRLARVVLTPCDAFDNFPPTILVHLKLLGRFRAAGWLMGQSLRLRPMQLMPIAFGWATAHRMDAGAIAEFARPLRENAGTRRDFSRLARAIDDRHTLAAGERLGEFEKPVLVVWSRHDRLFPLEHGERLAQLMPQAELRVVEDSGAFVPEDQPEELASLIRSFAAQQVPSAVV